jgi:hypothetical protein
VAASTRQGQARILGPSAALAPAPIVLGRLAAIGTLSPIASLSGFALLDAAANENVFGVASLTTTAIYQLANVNFSPIVGVTSAASALFSGIENISAAVGVTSSAQVVDAALATISIVAGFTNSAQTIDAAQALITPVASFVATDIGTPQQFGAATFSPIVGITGALLLIGAAQELITGTASLTPQPQIIAVAQALISGVASITAVGSLPQRFGALTVLGSASFTVNGSRLAAPVLNQSLITSLAAVSGAAGLVNAAQINAGAVATISASVMLSLTAGEFLFGPVVSITSYAGLLNSAQTYVAVGPAVSASATLDLAAGELVGGLGSFIAVGSGVSGRVLWAGSGVIPAIGNAFYYAALDLSGIELIHGMGIVNAEGIAETPPPPLPVGSFTPSGINIGVVTPAAFFAPVYAGTGQTLYLGQVGATLFFATGESLIYPFELVFTKPSSRTLAVTQPRAIIGMPSISMIAGRYVVFFPGGTYALFTFGPGEIDEVGQWSIYVRRNGVIGSGSGTFMVGRLM